jgi:hypothetical protein
MYICRSSPLNLRALRHFVTRSLVTNVAVPNRLCGCAQPPCGVVPEVCLCASARIYDCNNRGLYQTKLYEVQILYIFRWSCYCIRRVSICAIICVLRFKISMLSVIIQYQPAPRPCSSCRPAEALSSSPPFEASPTPVLRHRIPPFVLDSRILPARYNRLTGFWKDFCYLNISGLVRSTTRTLSSSTLRVTNWNCNGTTAMKIMVERGFIL